MNENTEQKRKRGRPRKEKNLVLYRSGNRIKAWNPVIGANVNIREKDMTGNVKIFDGLGFDWVNWGRKQTRDGFYNAATRFPFRQCHEEIDPAAMDTLEEEYKTNPKLKAVMDACAELFDGRAPRATVKISGVFWQRVLGNIFIQEAGADGISRIRFVSASGKVWVSVNVLPTQKRMYNYTLGPWYAVVNMIHPPSFCVQIAGAEYETAPWGASEKWQPHELASLILQRLWAHKGVNSCEAAVSKPETVVQETAEVSEAAPRLRCKTCGCKLTFDWCAGECFACCQLAKAKAAAEADPTTTRRCTICGEILQSVFADGICVRCAAKVNVEEGDE